VAVRIPQACFPSQIRHIGRILLEREPLGLELRNGTIEIEALEEQLGTCGCCGFPNHLY